MVSRVEVEVCGLLPYSNWPVFSHFWPEMTQNMRLSDFSPNYVLTFPNFVYNSICYTLEL